MMRSRSTCSFSFPHATDTPLSMPLGAAVLALGLPTATGTVQPGGASR
jgi:hypothetical protein